MQFTASTLLSLKTPGSSENKFFSFDWSFAFSSYAAPEHSPSPLHKVMGCTNSAVDRVPLPLCARSALTVWAALREIPKKRMKVLLREPGCPASVTNNVKESLQALLSIACTLLADSHVTETAPRPFIKICTWLPPAGGLHTMPIKLCGNHLTQANYFPALDLICVNKHPLGNTVKVLLVLLDGK